MINIPTIKLGIIGVSRDCFPAELTRKRLVTLVDACKSIGLDVYACKTIIENETDAMAALDELDTTDVNAAVIYLGNFGPEGPLSIFAKHFRGQVMACAAAEETGNNLMNGRGDAYCGLLNAAYNFNLRGVKVYIPQMPVGLPCELAKGIAHFEKVSRVVLGVRDVKIFSFGPRPQDFYACNAPIKPLYDIGVEVMENSELDLLALMNAVDEKDTEVLSTIREMEVELGKGNTYPDLIPLLARYEIALTRFYERSRGSRKFGIFANKCWPAFQTQFRFCPCYVNSRLASKGIPVACEVDIYGALSEYMCQLASDMPVTLLDINNTVPGDMIQGADLMGAEPADLFMGFHCGNTPSSCMKNCSIKYQFGMHRLLEGADSEPDISRGTLEGQIKPGSTTFFRLQGSAENELLSYIAEGEILDIEPESFGSIGIFAIPNFARFYRHVLIEKHFPHHGAVAFGRCGDVLFDAVKMLGVGDISFPLPANVPYPGENPFLLA